VSRKYTSEKAWEKIMQTHRDVMTAITVGPSERIAEANHRIANSLAAISGLVQRDLSRLARGGTSITAAEVRDTLVEAKARIDAVARLHRSLSREPDDDRTIDAGLYVQQVAQELVGSLTRSSSMTLRFAGEIGCPIAPARALYVGLIVIELLTNSVKYAHPTGVDGEIVVACRRVPNGIAIEVADDGIGLPEDFDVEGGDHHGISLVQSLARQIDAELSIFNEALGLRCVLKLSMPPTSSASACSHMSHTAPPARRSRSLSSSDVMITVDRSATASRSRLE
jgi:two-component sensor histidine kinase